MRKNGRPKNKKYTDSDIKSFCQSVEELLAKISDRSRMKTGKGRGRPRKAS